MRAAGRRLPARVQGTYRPRTRRVRGTLALDHDRDTSTCSGGEVARLALLDLLAVSPGVLLLDEPTNRRDRDATEWLAAGQMLLE